MIVYFTGTGNSRFCAEFLARQLEDTCIHVFSSVREKRRLVPTSEKPWVFVAPTYAWQLPPLFAELLRTGSFSGDQDAYFVMTCGSDIGAAGARNAALCAEMGLRYRGTVPVVMPENYIAMFSAPGPEGSEKLVSDAIPVLEQIAADIRQERSLREERPGMLDRLKSGIIHWGFFHFWVRDRAFRVSEDCIGCGKCREVCPLGNIRLEGGKPVWGGRCTHCMACICLCPAEAIDYGRSTRGKVRYRAPGYRGTEE